MTPLLQLFNNVHLSRLLLRDRYTRPCICSPLRRRTHADKLVLLCVIISKTADRPAPSRTLSDITPCSESHLVIRDLYWPLLVGIIGKLIRHFHKPASHFGSRLTASSSIIDKSRVTREAADSVFKWVKQLIRATNQQRPPVRICSITTQNESVVLYQCFFSCLAWELKRVTSLSLNAVLHVLNTECLTDVWIMIPWGCQSGFMGWQKRLQHRNFNR